MTLEKKIAKIDELVKTGMIKAEAIKKMKMSQGTYYHHKKQKHAHVTIAVTDKCERCETLLFVIETLRKAVK